MSNVLSRGPAVTLQKSGEGWKVTVHAAGQRFCAFGHTPGEAKANLQFLIGKQEKKT